MTASELMSRWKCKTCESYFTVKEGADMSRVSCCATPRLIIVSIDESREADERAKIEFGKCYEAMINFIDYYMDLPIKINKIVSVWILGTYLHESFEAYPYLFLNAMRGSGKTRLLKIIAHLAKDGRGEVHTGLSEAVFFRTPKHHTMAIDEFESVGGKNKQDLREYLNASYKKGGIVQRMKKVKDQYVVETFEPFKPIAMANIWGMDEVLGDRCVSIRLDKSDNPSKTKKMENFSHNRHVEAINRTLRAISCRLCLSVQYKNIIEVWNDYITDTHTQLPLLTQPTLLTSGKEGVLLDLDQEEMFKKIDETGIEGRNLELLFPLLITARMVNFETFAEILEIGKDIMASKKEDEMAESKDVSVIDFVANCPSNYMFDYTLQIELKRQFAVFIGEVEDNTEKWLNNEWFGRALKRLDLVLDKRRRNQGREITLNIAKAKEKLKMFRKKGEGEDAA